MSTDQSNQAVAEKPSRKALKNGEKDKKKESAAEEAKAEKVTRKQQKKKRKLEKRQNKKPRRRIFPIWLRIIIVSIAACAALVAGLMIGYGVLGDGNPTDALRTETWQHIIDIVTKVE
ncbi:DNA-directed RNA polymerase subunit beta [Oceanobacillus bengalensis]|uniref:DNA-directed RNA polymerase subunit beta n=1 Tax=Oceanobacillus bengalensis TaxID=1435466 RepID=A0A494Z026_9BACI|nr:DNA-directed RNA polymerase subunit beta [Oceanobacillus bengalensis]RKQ15338.1 DNA-directed RNA polymerase subunit beta [Oceanobacillus bengalensis]